MVRYRFSAIAVHGPAWSTALCTAIVGAPMATHASTQPKPNRRALRMAEVFDAAAAVFAEKGYHGTSTKDIADRLGLQQGSLYYYFASKEEALRKVCELSLIHI